jgi:hypothetical protein
LAPSEEAQRAISGLTSCEVNPSFASRRTMRAENDAPPSQEAESLVVPVRFRRDGLALNLFSTVTTLGGIPATRPRCARAARSSMGVLWAVMSTSDLEAWKALGPILARFVKESQDWFVDACRDNALLVLNLIGVNEDHPARALVARAFVDLDDTDLRGAADAGQLGLSARTCFRRLCVARELSESWRTTDESLELIGDPWASFWEALANSSLPWPLEVPERALEALAGLADEVAAAAKDPATTWPVFPTGDEYDELVGNTLAQVASRTGIPLESLPVAPPTSTLKALPMVSTDAAAALAQLHEWASERDDLARALGVLAPFLRYPPAASSGGGGA